MQSKFCSLIFAVFIGTTIVTLTGTNIYLIEPSNASYANQSQKQGSQLDSSLSSFIDTNKEIILHIHPTLNITYNGKPFPVPKGIGINITLWNDHSLDQYGMQPMKMTMGGQQ